jgi:hypothetical protein
MRVVQTRIAESESEGEVEVVTGGKGKQRAASVVVVKREKRTREEEEEEKKEKPKPKPRARTKPKVAPTGKKGKAKAKGSEPAELDEEGADQPMEIDIRSDDEPKPKQTHRLPGKSKSLADQFTNHDYSILDWAYEQLQQEKRIAVLEAQVTAFSRVAEEMTRMSQRVDAMQDQVFWFTGALENVLGRICLDDRRLVPEPM